ncbi:MAG: FAD-dependent thymidylate synthase [Spirochaetia bacterium]|nr:FAD-dependent thymidylate synthase [Spirochaetia bacterium]
MILIKPSYSILSEIDGKQMLKNIERAGRICYKSEDKITEESSVKFIEMLLNKGHESVLEHEKISILFVCDRGVSHELVRHRIVSFSQESTRYCNYSKDKFGNNLTFIMPYWIKESIQELLDYSYGYHGNGNPSKEATIWINSLKLIEKSYLSLLELGWQPQQARSILPNSLKTEIAVTANLREWRTIFKQRTSKTAHPQMRELMIPLLNELKSIIPVIFNDIEY